MTYSGFTEVSHTADLAVKVWASNPDELFRAAASALYALLGTNQLVASAGFERTIQFSLEAVDAESQLVNFLNELLYYYQQEGCVLADFSFTRCDNQLMVEGRGKKSNGEAKEIKAATYHEMDIRETERGLETIIVFDV